VSVSEASVPLPIEYTPTGDHALLMAWSAAPPIILAGVGDWRVDRVEMFSQWLRENTRPRAVLCLEDGRAVLAGLDEIKFDFRWSEAKQQFVDVSGVSMDDDEDAPEGEEEEGADTDQASPDDGGQGVPGPVPEAD